MENLRLAAPKVIILRLRHYPDSQVVIYIACKLCTSKLINQKTIILVSKGKSYLVLQDLSFNFIIKEYAYTVTYTYGLMKIIIRKIQTIHDIIMS